MTAHEDLLARADSAIRGDGVYLARVARVLIEDLRAAVAAANQRAEQAETERDALRMMIDGTDNGTVAGRLFAERNAAYQRAEQAEAMLRRIAALDDPRLDHHRIGWDLVSIVNGAEFRALVADQPDPDHRRHQ